jgi:hypothetical protein
LTLFLRDENNNTICECDFFTDEGSLDVSCSVSIINYTKILAKNLPHMQKIAQVFDELDEMRGLLWERHPNVMGNDYDMAKAVSIVRSEYERVAPFFNLSVVED